MNIVNFTPITATLGGMIIGLAVVIFFLLMTSYLIVI